MMYILKTPLTLPKNLQIGINHFGKERVRIFGSLEWSLAEDLNWKKLSNKRRRQLCKEFTQDEVWNAINSLSRGKAPGPNGFNTEFYIRYWSILKDSIFKAFNEFSSIAIVPSSWGSTNLVFVPKKEGPSLIVDYRPIALCNVLYKILSKVIVNRLKPHIKFLISKDQSAFIEGRKI
ncbi:retrotransposon protein [Canna indica]|uniref:Retrotransposon protein n=1 Tax=Canna indica TaxID=4628 RepID=A0AAQ3JMT8_9LILI|nr:retrotransposon protein [Canna indica]